jgi:hypothetical protein
MKGLGVLLMVAASCRYTQDTGTIAHVLPNSYAVWASMNVSKWQAIKRVPCWVVSLIFVPTHLLNCCEGLLFRNCLAYRRYFIRKRLGA